MDKLTNFFQTNLTNLPYSSTDTLLSITEGDALKLPTPPFNLVVWNHLIGPPENDDNVEIIRVTEINGDVLTVLRAQEGTSASSKLETESYRCILSATEKTFDDIHSALSSQESQISSTQTDLSDFKAQKGSQDGLAPLDNQGFVPISHTNPSVRSTKVVNTITERDAIDAGERYEGFRVHVVDASADSTVGTGNAGYILKSGLANTDWVKTYENESLDIDTTDDISEGSVNLYFTGSRAISAIKGDAAWNATNWDTAFGWGDHASVGYITGYSVTQSDVTQHEAALTITESQISDLTSYLGGSGITLTHSTTLNEATFALTGDSFNASGDYTGLRARSTTKGDVGLGSVPNIDATNANNISTGTLSEARLPSSALIGDTTYSAGGGIELDINNVFSVIAGSGLTQTTTGLALSGNSFNNSGDYSNLRARSTTKTDVGLSGIPNTNGSTSNYLRGDGSWVTPPNTTYSAGTGLSLTGTQFSLSGDSFNNTGSYSGLRAQATTKGDVGLGGIPNINNSTSNFLRGDGSWVTPPNTDTTYSAGGGLSLSGTTFSLSGNSFNSSGDYSGLRARATTIGDVGGVAATGGAFTGAVTFNSNYTTINSAADSYRGLVFYATNSVSIIRKPDGTGGNNSSDNSSIRLTDTSINLAFNGGATRFSINSSGNASVHNNLDVGGSLTGVSASDVGAVPTGRTLTINGTTNQISSSAGSQSLASNRVWTLSLPQNIHSGATPEFAGVEMGNFRIEHNSVTDSLDFNYIGV